MQRLFASAPRERKLEKKNAEKKSGRVRKKKTLHTMLVLSDQEDTLPPSRAGRTVASGLNPIDCFYVTSRGSDGDQEVKSGLVAEDLSYTKMADVLCSLRLPGIALTMKKKRVFLRVPKVVHKGEKCKKSWKNDAVKSGFQPYASCSREEWSLLMPVSAATTSLEMC